MPDVPVPDTANANEPSGAWNRRIRRVANIVQQTHHQWIEMTDRRCRHRAHDPRRCETRAGAEQDAILIGKQAHAGISSKCASASRSTDTAVSGTGRSGGRGTPTSYPSRFSAGFQSGHSVRGTEQTRERSQASLQGNRFVVPARAGKFEEAHARIRYRAAERQDPTGCTDAEGRVERRPPIPRAR